MQLFYNPQLQLGDKAIKFDKKESGHISKVLRKVKGDKLHITNGKGYVYLAEITNTNPNKCFAKILHHEFHPPLPYALHIAIAPTKRNERFEWFLEKATELGITQITPLICEHSERRHIKLERFQRVLQSAMKQSLQYYLPTINPPVAFSEFITKTKEGTGFIAHCEKDSEKIFLKEKLFPRTSVTILIGPEGDFSSEEIQMALQKKQQPVSLGKNRLRTETAAVAACHTVALINQ